MPYYVYKDGQTNGPYDGATIHSMTLKGQLDIDDQVFREGTEHWATIRDTFYGAEDWKDRQKVIDAQSIATKDVTNTGEYKYYINKNGQTYGPYDKLTIKRKIELREFSLGDEVCRVGTENWTTIQSYFLDAKKWYLSELIAESQSNTKNPPLIEPRESKEGKFITHKCFKCNHIKYKSMACSACGEKDRWKDIYDPKRKTTYGLFCQSCDRGYSDWVCENCGKKNAITESNTSVPINLRLRFIGILFTVFVIAPLWAFFALTCEKYRKKNNGPRIDPMKPFKVYPDEER